MMVGVIGGTGLAGSKVVARLPELGHEAVPASPRLVIDTITGEGLARARPSSMTGCVDPAASASGSRRPPSAQ
jgi:hypothetical protein